MMEERELKVGMKFKAETVVDKNNTAKSLRSGGLDVFATPMMVALMEKASCDGVAPYLAEGEGTVGTKVNITHDSATPIGMKVVAESELVEIDGRRLVFKVEAFDEKGHIGGGTHERFIIRNEKFQSKTDSKLA